MKLTLLEVVKNCRFQETIIVIITSKRKEIFCDY